jgi:hypothetical protein
LDGGDLVIGHWKAVAFDIGAEDSSQLAFKIDLTHEFSLQIVDSMWWLERI